MSTPKRPLVQELGYQYINEFFRGALFLKGNTLYQIRHCYEDTIGVHAVNGDAVPGSASWRSETVPASILNSFSDIKWPRLGYRNFTDNLYKNQVAFVTSNRSVQRGLKYDNLAFELLPIGNMLGASSMGSGRSVDTLLNIFFPVWFTFKEGMKELKAQSIPAFAVNEDIAIGLSVDQGPDRYADIYFRGKVVGLVQENSEIIVSNKTLKRGNLKQLYSLLEV